MRCTTPISVPITVDASVAKISVGRWGARPGARPLGHLLPESLRLPQTSRIQCSSSSLQLSLDAFKDTRCDITQLRPLEFVPILRQLKEDLLDFLI